MFFLLLLLIIYKMCQIYCHMAVIFVEKFVFKIQFLSNATNMLFLLSNHLRLFININSSTVTIQLIMRHRCVFDTLRFIYWVLKFFYL